MKKIVSKLLGAILFLGIVGYVQAEEYQQILVNNKNTNSQIGIGYDSKVIELGAGDKVSLINVIRSSNNVYQFFAKISVKNKEGDAEFTTVVPYNVSGSSAKHFNSLWEFTGPLKVQFGAEKNNESWLVATAVITRAYEQKGNNLTGYSLVLPESADTNYKLVLESSTDLVDWKADQTGSKAPSNRKRFYRLRAVKE